MFAVWAARPGVEVGNIERVLRRVRDAGVVHLEEIAAREAQKVGLTEIGLSGLSPRQLAFRIRAA